MALSCGFRGWSHRAAHISCHAAQAQGTPCLKLLKPRVTACICIRHVLRHVACIGGASLTGPSMLAKHAKHACGPAMWFSRHVCTGLFTQAAMLLLPCDKTTSRQPVCFHQKASLHPFQAVLHRHVTWSMHHHSLTAGSVVIIGMMHCWEPGSVSPGKYVIPRVR